MDPYLDYRTFQHLTIHEDPLYFSPHLAYCPTRLIYPLRSRRSSTKEILDPWKPQALEEVQDGLDAGIKMWEDSKDCRQLQSLFRAASVPSISKVVAFGCSTMAFKVDQRGTSITQHALILTMRDIVKQMTKSPDKPGIQCFAQDPIYTEVDKEVLRRSGITVLEDPRAFLEVDDETVVVSFAPDIPVRQIIADIARPAVLVWNTVWDEDEAAAFWHALHPSFNPGCA